jgi:hypothetical protein
MHVLQHREAVGCAAWGVPIPLHTCLLQNLDAVQAPNDRIKLQAIAVENAAVQLQNKLEARCVAV